MVWSWSHTPEAYQNARDNLSRLPAVELITIRAEWYALTDRERDCNAFSAGRYHRACRYLQKRYRRAIGANGNPRLQTVSEFCETLSNEIWEKAENLANCTNGGFSAWVCPYGCGPHLVSFSRPDEKDYERE